MTATPHLSPVHLRPAAGLGLRKELRCVYPRELSQRGIVRQQKA